jgi:hypothetical protein
LFVPDTAPLAYAVVQRAAFGKFIATVERPVWRHWRVGLASCERPQPVFRRISPSPALSQRELARGRRNTRGVKREMSNWPLRPRHAKPPPPIIVNQVIQILK